MFFQECLAEETRARSLNLLHRYYDWQLIEELPLTALGELLSYARKEEARKEKLEAEKQLAPLWFVNYAIARLRGQECMDFKTFIEQAFDKGPEPAPSAKKSGEDILAEFAPFIEVDRLRGADG